MKVEIYSREKMEGLLASLGEIKAAVISFHDCKELCGWVDDTYAPIDFCGRCSMLFEAGIPDIDWDELDEFGLDEESYLKEADELAEFIYRAKAAGLDIICQCEHGQSRSAGCAAAILEHFSGRGIDIFANYSYYPSKLVYKRVLGALEALFPPKARKMP